MRRCNHAVLCHYRRTKRFGSNTVRGLHKLFFSVVCERLSLFLRLVFLSVLVSHQVIFYCPQLE